MLYNSLPLEILEIIIDKLSNDTKFTIRLVSKELYQLINLMEIKISKFNTQLLFLKDRISEYDMQSVCKTKQDWDIYFSAIEYCANQDCPNKESYNMSYTHRIQYHDYFFDKGEIFYHRKTPALGIKCRQIIIYGGKNMCQGLHYNNYN